VSQQGKYNACRRVVGTKKHLCHKVFPARSEIDGHVAIWRPNPLLPFGNARSTVSMEFSRAIAFACFTATKWLALILAVLFAALVVQAVVDETSHDPVFLFVLFCAAALVLAGLMHWLGARISS
jgi:hypothetical protein